MFNVYKNQLSRQTGSRNLTDPKTLPTIWGTYMKLVTKYQISAIKVAELQCMFNVSDGSKNASHDMGYLYKGNNKIKKYVGKQEVGI